MDYSKLNDFEINKLAAEISYSPALSLQVERDVPGRDSVTIFADLGDSDELVSIACKDYCNNPADAWAIIRENKISIEFYDCGLCLAFSLNNMQFNAEDKNPLRAAMIVFLMMQESE